VAYRHESRKSLLAGDLGYQPYAPGGYHDREGLAPPVVGAGPRQRKMYMPKTTWTWSFLIVAVVQAAIVLALESYVFARFQQAIIKGLPSKPQTKPVPTDLSLFIFGFIYQLVLVYDSLRLKNTIQVIGLCIYNLGMLVYASIQVDQINKAIAELEQSNYILPNSPIWADIRAYLVAVPCVISLGTIILAFIAWKINDEFAWTIYKHISADLRMKRRFLTFQIYIALLKFDFFFFVGFTVQFLVVVTDVSDTEFALTCAAIPITILILVMAAFWTRRENMVGMIIIIILYLGGLAYFIFKLARMYQPHFAPTYLPARKTMTVFAVITVILIVLTIINTIMCINNFNKGLKPHVMRRKITSEEEKMVHMNELPDLKHGTAPTRMTID